MWQKMPNIAQVEFLHLGDGKTIESIFRDARELERENPDLNLPGNMRRFPGKTVVRFHDEGGELTALVLRVKRLQERQREILKIFQSTRGLKHWLLNRESGRNAGKLLKLRKKIYAQSLNDLEIVVKSVSSLAVELKDHSFRPVESREAHELLESAQAAKGAQLFVFEPNSLLADKNKIIGALV